jgi:SAM-dependent methyltransferase
MIAKRIARSMLDRFLLRRLPGPFHHEQGNCWIARVPHLLHLADSAADLRYSTLALYEDGIPLQRAHSLHADIRAIGNGRYLHWQEQVKFSTSDNTNPNCNGRTYYYSLSPWLFQRRIGRQEADTAPPVNHQKRDCRPERIRADVERTLVTGKGYLETLRRLLPSLAGRTVLEVGPGINCGCVMLLAAYGARPMVVDRFLTSWENDYHGKFYAFLAEELARRDPQANVRPIAALVEAGRYSESIICRHQTAIEGISATSQSIDYIVSNAVVEHLYDLERSFAQLHRITKAGGCHLHQVDFRDHRDFSLPLEYLLLDEGEFQMLFHRCHSECGNRYRPSEMTARIRAAGFEILSFEGNMFSSPQYLDRFLPRLRSSGSRYQGWRAEELEVISGLYQLRKPTAN